LSPGVAAASSVTTMQKKEHQDIASPFFHGTLAEFIPGIMAGGIKCQPGEPCFTKNLILACCRYANRGRNSNHIYSGKIFSDAETLIQQGLVNPRDKKELLLEETRKYWDKNDNSSAVFVFFPTNLVPGPTAAAHLEFDHQNKLVSGGITKWLEGHTALYQNQTNNKKQKNNQKFLRGRSRGGRFFQKEPSPGRIQSLPVLRAMLWQYQDVIIGLKDDNTIAEQLKKLIIDHMVILAGNNPPLDMERLLEKILEQTVVTTLLSEIRRGFLSILRSQGYTIYKTDHHPPYVEVNEVFWPEAQIDRNTKNLFFSITKRYKAYKDLEPCIRMIERLRENSYPADYILYVYKELDKITWFYD
jgi:hypothetical protein